MTRKFDLIGRRIRDERWFSCRGDGGVRQLVRDAGREDLSRQKTGEVRAMRGGSWNWAQRNTRVGIRIYPGVRQCRKRFPGKHFPQWSRKHPDYRTKFKVGRVLNGSKYGYGSDFNFSMCKPHYEPKRHGEDKMQQWRGAPPERVT